MPDSNHITLPDNIHERSQFFYLALSVFLSRQQNSVLPEIVYFMEPDQIITFIETFGGSTVRVPSTKEFGGDLLLSCALFYHYQRGMTWAAIQEKLGLGDLKFNTLRRQADEYAQFAKQEVGMDPGQILGLGGSMKRPEKRVIHGAV